MRIRTLTRQPVRLLIRKRQPMRIMSDETAGETSECEVAADESYDSDEAAGEASDYEVAADENHDSGEAAGETSDYETADEEYF